MFETIRPNTNLVLVTLISDLMTPANQEQSISVNQRLVLETSTNFKSSTMVSNVLNLLMQRRYLLDHASYLK